MITRHARGGQLARHRHAEPYVAVVLSGAYVEAGDGGRWRAEPGTVLVHEAHEAHRDQFDAAATVLNLPHVAGLEGAGLIDDADAVARLAERDPRAAAALIRACWRPGAPTLADWPDLLAGALLRDPGLSLAGWADTHGLTATSLSRGFGKVYGVSPKRYRLEARARQAARALAASGEPLAALAAAHGFADQAHMTRAIVALTGATPGMLRAKSVQAGNPAPA